MRYFVLILILSLTVSLSSCGKAESRDRLGYQKDALYVEADVMVDGTSVPLKIELAAPEFDGGGRMLARSAAVTVGEGSVLAGVRFEVVGGDYFVCSGDLRIPVAEESTVSGITDIISLFCISEESYHSSERIKTAEGEREVSVYRNGGNFVEVTSDLTSGMPARIYASIDGRELIADIEVCRQP